MISQELAKAVLSGEYNKLRYSNGKVIACYINIHELAHKCKEWANTKGYWVHSQQQYNFQTEEASGSAFVHLNNDIPTELFKIKLNTEPEAIFDACEWILQNQSE